MSNKIGYDSIGVISYIVKKCMEYGYDVNLIKAQKLLYCCYGTVLAQFNVRLCREHPKAWQYGPAFPRAYNAHRKNKIDYDAEDPISAPDCPDYIKYMVDATIQHFGKCKACELSDWTHREGSPWHVSSNNGEHLYEDISDSLIRIYFKKIIKSYDGPSCPGQERQA